MKFHEAIVTLKKGKTRKLTGAGESANNSLYIYDDPERRERNQSLQDHDPARRQERGGGAYRLPGALNSGFLPVYFESDYRTALAYVSEHENVDFYPLTVDDKHGMYIQGAFTEIIEKLLDVYRERSRANMHERR